MASSERAQLLHILIAADASCISDRTTRKIPEQPDDLLLDPLRFSFHICRVDKKFITGTGKFAVKTPDVDIKVNPDRLDLVETKFIGGRRCLVIAVEDNVEVNGMPVKMWEEQKEAQ